MWIFDQFTILNISVHSVSKHEIFPDLDEVYDEDAENENSANESGIAAAGPNDPPLTPRLVAGKLFSIKMLLDQVVLTSDILYCVIYMQKSFLIWH